MPFGRYLVPGIMTGIIFAAFMYRYGWPKMLWHAVYFLPLVIIFFIDLEHKIIPNSLVIALLALSIPKVCSNLDVKLVLGGLMAGGIFLLLALLSQGGLGGGDIKLAAALGLWFGWQEMLLLIFLAFLVGGLVAVLLLLLGVKSRKDAIPFAPFLVGAAFSVTMWGKEILQWYLQLSGLQFK
ncbi:MAG: prepilin peptidase [Firmicutes bacterium]|nr:prepilin peptidase [Bacillota bacterium]